MKFEYWRAKKKWWFHIIAANGEIIAPSEGYSRRIDMIATILNIKVNAHLAAIRPRKKKK